MFYATARIHFRTVTEALREARIVCRDSSPNTILVWHDSIKDGDYFKFLYPWQVVNRIPNMNVLCRKTSFIRLIQRIQPYFPEIYTFIPKTYILPFKKSDFMRSLEKKSDKMFIVKPDSGSLGQGIKIIRREDNFIPDNTTLAVAQEYISSMLVYNRKFDFRIYVLIASVEPLRIYVFKDGLARFCTEEFGSTSLLSHITNVSFNKENGNPLEIETISKLISDEIPKFESLGIDFKKLWEKIEHIIVLTILSSYQFLKAGIKRRCKPIGFSRCFQILGFDVILDKNQNPYILEVNYRPSLDFYRPKERRMKAKMIGEAIIISTPNHEVQCAVNDRKWSWDNKSWESFIKGSGILGNDDVLRDNFVKTSGYRQVYPASGVDQEIYDRVMDVVNELSIEEIPGFNNQPSF